MKGNVKFEPYITVWKQRFSEMGQLSIERFREFIESCFNHSSDKVSAQRQKIVFIFSYAVHFWYWGKWLLEETVFSY